MSQVETCKVCDLYDQYPDIALRFNTKLKQYARIKEIIKEFHTLGVIDPPNKYFLEKHRDSCLTNFVVEKQALPLRPLNDVQVTPPVFENIISDEFRDKSLFDKTLWFQNKLIELIYVNLSKIRYDVATPKQDVDVNDAPRSRATRYLVEFLILEIKSRLYPSKPCFGELNPKEIKIFLCNFFLFNK